MGVLMLRIVILPKPTWQAQKGDKKWGGGTLSTNLVPRAFPLRNPKKVDEVAFPHLLTMQANVIFTVFKRLWLFFVVDFVLIGKFL